jgi:hypothetical protein
MVPTKGVKQQERPHPSSPAGDIVIAKPLRTFARHASSRNRREEAATVLKMILEPLYVRSVDSLDHAPGLGRVVVTIVRLSD